jgi:hypothetical protein
MRSVGFRRAALATGVAAVAAVALAGCSAGQVAETALKRPSNMGVNVENSDGSIFIRNLAVQYPGTTGYKAGENAPLQLGLFNQTRQEITVVVSSQPGGGVVSASSVGLTGGAANSSPAAAEPSAAAPSATPSAEGSQEPGAEPSASAVPPPAGPVFRPARITVPAMGTVAFLPGDVVQLQAVDLSGPLAPGQALNLVFGFSNLPEKDNLVVQAPVGIPLTPASRAPVGVPGENTEE